MNKLVFISPSATGGGAERIQINIMNSLHKEKHSIYFITTDASERPADLDSNIIYISLKYKHFRNATFKLYSILRKISPDYIFTTSIVSAGIIILINKVLRSNNKVFVRIAVPPSDQKNRTIKSKALFLINKFILNKADLIIAQTDFSRLDITKNYRISNSKIQVIRNIVDYKTLDKRSKEYIPSEFRQGIYNIVASGALYSTKGFDLLIKAFARFKKQYQNSNLFILGKERSEVNYKAKLDQLIKGLNMEDSVFLLGHKNNPYPYYKHADLFVMSSRHEGFPNVVLESLSLQTPVLATNCVDFDGVIENNRTGIIVDRNSADALYQGLLESKKHLTKLKEFRLENFDYNQLFK